MKMHRVKNCVWQMSVALVLCLSAPWTADAGRLDVRDTPYFFGNRRMSENRLNLWPLAYHDDESTTVLGLVNARKDYFGFAPFYSQHDKGTSTHFSLLWPYASFDVGGDDGWAFPLFWSKSSFTFFPLFSCAEDRFTSLIYSSYDRGWNAGVVLAGQHNDKSWFLPFYFKRGDYLVTLPFGMSLSSGDWCSPISLSWHTSDRTSFLLGLGGYTKQSDWLFPLWYRDAGGFASLAYYYTPHCWWVAFGLAGATSLKQWCLPFFLRTPEWTHTLLASWNRDLSSVFSLPLLSWVDEGGGRLLAGIAGWGNDGSNWLFPIYGWSTNSFETVLFGSIPNDKGGRTSWYTPLVISQTGRQESLAVFFGLLGFSSKDASFDQRLAELDSATLPAEVLAADVETVGASESSGIATQKREPVSHPRARMACERSWWAGILCRGRDVMNEARLGEKGEIFEMSFVGKSSCIPFYSTTKTRHKRYLAKNHWQASDDYQTESFSVLGPLYESTMMKGPARTLTRSTVLWKVWAKDVSDSETKVDAFPFFSKNTHKDGSTKTTWVGGLYEHESTPDGQTHLKLFYIKLW